MVALQERASDLKELAKKTRKRLRSGTVFQDCVDEAYLVKIDYAINRWWDAKYSCWAPKGRVADDFETISPKIVHELQQSCKESCRSLNVQAYMVGTSPGKAKPYICISSKDRASRKQAKIAIERSNILSSSCFKLWLLQYPPQGPIELRTVEHDFVTQPPLAGSSSEVHFDTSESLESVEMPVYIKRSAKSIRRATVNALNNGKDYGYITVADALKRSIADSKDTEEDLEDFEMPFDSESESESDNDEDEGILSQQSHTSLEVTGLERLSLTSYQCSESRSQSLSRFNNIVSLSSEQSTNYSHTSIDTQAPVDTELLPTNQSSATKYELLENTSVTLMARDCVVIPVTHPGVMNDIKENERW